MHRSRQARAYGSEKTAQSFFDPARLILSVDGNPTQVVLTNAMVGCEAIFAGELAASHFIDKIPTVAAVASSDEWDDGGRVEYPRVAPGIVVTLVLENRSDQRVSVSAAFLGLRSYSPFPWDQGESAPWDRTQR